MTDKEVPQAQEPGKTHAKGQTEGPPKPSQEQIDPTNTKARVQPELTFRALSHLLIVFLGAILVVISLVSMWKENRFGWPLRGII